MSAIEHFQSTIGSAGLKVSVQSVFDPADSEYNKIPDEIRAAVWFSAKNHGWTINGLKSVMKFVMMERYEEVIADFNIDWLQESARKFPEILK